ncbi:signal transduction histidine kinase [Methanolobus tindarius DSM 2278]|uniref:histidine kinase n=1 Tax=Methanolobus tindarius DSM 2278 TaxID=1090322 RepID=W9DRC9_METTI|nr:ATP-binding protein [Methanolobus tindarius]ETA69314.1 signal transduction histidine kinase [Methanolobus tindarius DSM 2278]
MHCKENNSTVTESSFDAGKCEQYQSIISPDKLTLYKELPLGVLLTDMQRYIHYCNPAFTRITGFAIEEIYGLSMDNVFCCNSHNDNNNSENSIPEIENDQIFTCKWNTKLNIEKDIRCKKVDARTGNSKKELFAWYVEDRSFSFENKENFCVDIDENESGLLLHRKLEIEKVISFISSALVAPDNLDEVIVESLGKTCNVCGASRAYLFRFDDENLTMSNTHEWNEEGVEAQKDNLQDLPQDMFPWWMDKIGRNEIIHVKEVAKMPPEASAEKEILEMQDITSLLVLPVYVSGKVNGFIGLDNVKDTGKWSIEDVTVLGAVANIIGSAIGQQEAQDKLNERNRKLIRAYEELKSMEIMKYEFISNLSHELKTPLNSIRGYSEILIDNQIGNLNQKQKKSVDAIFNSSKKLGNLIDSLLYMASVLAGKTCYQFDPIQMENVIDNAVSHHEFEATKRKINLQKKVTENLPIINGDVYFLPQLMYKLIDNALKFTPENGNVEILACEIDDGIHIEVSDTGIGIPPSELKKIFDPFYQIDGSSTRRYGGNGIGLHIAKKVVDAHNGRIWVESTEGKGTSVHIFLPVDPKNECLIETSCNTIPDSFV